MGCARWKGVRLKDILDKVGIKKDAIEIVLDGADGPMLHYYQAGFANPFHERQQTVSKPEDWSKKTYGALRPQSTPQPTSATFAPAWSRGIMPFSAGSQLCTTALT